jgi:hypothetical protein
MPFEARIEETEAQVGMWQEEEAAPLFMEAFQMSGSPSRESYSFQYIIITTTFLCSASAPLVQVVPLLDVCQLLMLFVGTLTYSEPRTSFWII